MILVVDNRDSYTYNLVQLLRSTGDRDVVVVSADDREAALELVESEVIDGVIISPGPGHPEDEHDFGTSDAVIRRVLERDEVPLLGVCLGHQGLARHFGYRVVPAPEPRHGWLSPLEHAGDRLFEGIAAGTRVTRYHSLMIEPVPGAHRHGRELRVTARSEDGVIQAVEVPGKPWFGVQFHPESIASDEGPRLLANFLRIVDDHARHRAPERLHLAVRAVRGAVGGAAAAVLREVLARGRGSFWLDSALADADGSRWSVVGDAVDPTGEGVAEVRVERDAPHGAFERLALEQAAATVVGGAALPFRGGLVVALSYELGLRELGVEAPADARSMAGEASAEPEVLVVRPARFVVVDRQRGTVTACVLARDAAAGEAAVAAFATEAEAAIMRDGHADTVIATSPGDDSPPAEIGGAWADDRSAYLTKIERCRAALQAGESYELCLTNRFDVDEAVRVDPLELFEVLLRDNPAPYAALIEVDDDGSPLAIVSASPERFLRGRDGRYETKPIKGTAPRAADPTADAASATALAGDPKVFAENLMIVDLLRNDLGRVCRPGSVRVPSLMAVESYATVHQLVSTILGETDPEVRPVDVVRALFPGGSMTGAPKLRSVELLAALEGRPRGLYSGVLGVLGADGSVELSIVIRTAVLARGRWTIGAGGAIVLDSDPAAEADEVELKARAIRCAFARAVARG